MFTSVRSLALRVLAVGSLAFSFVLAASFPSPAAAQSAGAPFPHTMIVSPELQGIMVQMLLASPTFRAQFERVEQALVLLTVRLEPALDIRSFRARSRIRRYESGLLVVNMEIAPGSQEPLWIAHEFEHLLEHVEGLDLTALARRKTPGVWFSGTDMVETSRATRAGRAVMDEIRRHQRSDNLVQ